MDMSSAHARGASSRGVTRIVDAHFHLWDLEENYYPWLCDGDRPSLIKDYSTLRRSYRAADFLRDIGSVGVVAAVHIQAEHDQRDPVRETRWLQRVADDPSSRGFPQAIVADADFASPDVERVLEEHRAFRNVRGVRHALHRRLNDPSPYDPLLDSLWTRNFPLLAKHGLSFDLQAFPRQVDGALALIRANPDVQFVLTHAAMPFASEPGGIGAWRDAVRRYAELPNVAIKISGFGGFDAPWTAASIDPFVSEVVSAFEPQRCMLASNFPVERLVMSYADIWHAYFECFASYSSAEREMLFARTAERVYRLGAAQPTTV